MSSYLFLSHGPDDVGYVDRLVEYLATAGVPVWIGQHVDYGDQSVIHAQIDGSAGVIMLMSPSAQASTWVARELNWAESRDIPIFPLLRSGEAFLRLAEREYVDVSTGEMPPPPFIARLRNRLAAAQLEVEARATAAATHTAALAAPGVPLPRAPRQAQRTAAGARSLPVAATAAVTVLILLATTVVAWLASSSGDALAEPDITASTVGRASLTITPGSSPDQLSQSASPGQTNPSARPTAHTSSGVGGQTTAASSPPSSTPTTTLAPTVTSMTLSPLPPTMTCDLVPATVTISPAVPTPTTISISSSDGTVASVPDSIVIAADDVDENFSISCVGPGTVTITVGTVGVSDQHADIVFT